jgi:predicted RNA-binding protein with PIN domain
MNTKTKKTNLIFRLTEEEKQFIEMTATLKNFHSVSDYIRCSLIYPQQLDRKISQDLIYEINKIGVNLNQMTRRVNKKKSIDNDFLQEIALFNSQLEQVINLYKELVK